MCETKIKLTHYAFLEGVDAATMGYTGKNPYENTGSIASKTARAQWQRGYLKEIERRLNIGQEALGK